MLVKELDIRGAKVQIYDDYIRSPEESAKLMKEFNELASKFITAKYRRLAQEAEQAKESAALKANDDKSIFSESSY